jgi:hypothetical protein
MEKKFIRIELYSDMSGPDLLDAIEGAVVTYMAQRFTTDEKGMREMITAKQEVRESYQRKIRRGIDQAIKLGIPAGLFAQSA